MRIDFPEWTPDLSTLANTGLEVCKNVFPNGKTYACFPGPNVVSTNALTNMSQGAASFFSAALSPFNFAGDISKLYLAVSNAYTNVSKVGGYTTPATQRWYFTQFGETILATNFNDPIQSYVMGSSALFANLAGSPPVCKYLVGLLDIGFLMVANIASFPYRVQWSAFNDITNWTPSSTTQAGFQDLNSDAGQITQIVGGEYITVFQERAICRGLFIGSPLNFQFTQVEKNRGTLAPGSVVKFGIGIAYLGLDGFYVFDGNSSTPIGANKIDNFFYADFDSAYLQNVQSVNVPQKQLLLWIYPGVGNNAGLPNKYLAFNYSPNSEHRWTYGEIEIETIFLSRSNAITIDGLGAIYSTIDAIPSTFDDPFFSGGVISLSGFNSSHQQTTFTGDCLDAEIETSDYQITPGKRTIIRQLKPIMTGAASITTYIGERNTIGDTIVYNGPSVQNSEGLCPTRSNARYQRFKLTTSGQFDNLIGIEVPETNEGSVR